MCEIAASYTLPPPLLWATVACEHKPRYIDHLLLLLLLCELLLGHHRFWMVRKILGPSFLIPDHLIIPAHHVWNYI